MDEIEHHHTDVVSQLDETYELGAKSDTSLENFMQRPIRIASFSWTPGTSLYSTINPWGLFFSNARVINRIANYNLLRCKLNVKFIINGNGFYYGRLLASYVPLDDTDDVSVFSSAGDYNVQRTQRPHVLLDPTTSQGGIMTLPFIWPKNYLKIPDEEWDSMGKMEINTLNDLTHATGSTDPITITVMAWASDFSIEVPTTAEPTLTAQSGEDEYDGVISKPASLVARVAGALTKIPVISPFAKATKMAASTVADIAKLFGMSRPNVISAPMPYQPKYYGNLANTNVQDTCQKLTLDTKQELTIDPRTMGLSDVDEMSLKSITEREAWIGTFTWSTSNAAESLIGNIRVTPMHFREPNTDEFVLPPVAFATLPFRYWRGALRFRFQIVASAFHKGRFKLVYDPQYSASNEYNVNYTQIIDIANTRDFSIDVGWGSEAPYRRVEKLSGLLSSFSTTAFTSADTTFSNGVLTLRPVTLLAAPDGTSGQSIGINVYVSAGPGFAVVDPESANLEDVFTFTPQCGEGDFILQTGDTDPNTVSADEDNAPEHSHSNMEVAATVPTTDHTHDVFFGDPVVSFRQVLKRYNLSRTYPLLGNTNEPSVVSFKALPNFPTYPGFGLAGRAIDSVIKATVAYPFNMSRMTLLNYVSSAFVMRRGGIRWKVCAAVPNFYIDQLSLSRHTGVNNLAYSQITEMKPIGDTTNEQQFALYDKFPLGLDGMAATPATRNPVVEAEFPFQSPLRFLHARNMLLTLNEDNRKELHELTYVTDRDTATTAGCFPAYVSIGEDFTLGFFLSTPTLFVDTLSGVTADTDTNKSW